jgi:hypothetical protein
VEGVDRFAIVDGKRHVNAAVRSTVAPADPEDGPIRAESTHLRNRFHQEPETERRERLLVEGLAALVVAHVQPDVVNHRRASFM